MVSWNKLRNSRDTHNLAKELTCRLNATPRRYIFAVEDSGLRGVKLLDESLVGDNAAIEVNFYGRAMSALHGRAASFARRVLR